MTDIVIGVLGEIKHWSTEIWIDWKESYLRSAELGLPT